MLLNRVKTDLFALDLFSDPFDASDRMSSEGKLHALPAGTGKCVDSRGAFVLGCLRLDSARTHFNRFGPSAAP
jgi:hypothetical protein